jgi:hypothetical protein
MELSFTVDGQQTGELLQIFRPRAVVIVECRYRGYEGRLERRPRQARPPDILQKPDAQAEVRTTERA